MKKRWETHSWDNVCSLSVLLERLERNGYTIFSILAGGVGGVIVVTHRMEKA